MSEFECRYGHLVRHGQDCAQCAKDGRFGERAYYMDGLTGNQWRQREEYEDRMAEIDDRSAGAKMGFSDSDIEAEIED